MAPGCCEFSCHFPAPLSPVISNMATRTHGDVTVNERRLRPIYDCLDNGNNKKALQEAEKLLKKQRDFQCAKVLKSLALIRLGRQDESLGTLKEVHAEGPTDDATLQAMTICYRELHKPELIADVYEMAVKKDQQNEELLSHLFMAYVRIGDYKKQQQTAMALYKLKPKNPYYFWAVMSVVMQACCAEEKLAQNMLLPLAERMTEKFAREGKIEAEAEVHLYLMILEKQGKYEEALQLLDGPLHDKFSDYLDFMDRKKAELLTNLKRWPKVNSAYKKLILGTPDQWSYYLEYFDTVEHLIDSNWTPENSCDNLDPSPDYNFQMAQEFVDQIIDKQDKETDQRKIFRGPYLARLELMKRMKSRNIHVPSESVVECFTSVFKIFGAKNSCFLDMSQSLDSQSLAQCDINKILGNMRENLTSEENGEVPLPETVSQMNRHISYCLLQHYTGANDALSFEQKQDLMKNLIERYHHGLQFGAELGSTGLQPSDTYCLLAAHIMIDMWKESGDERIIVQTCALLEQSLGRSPSNFQFKLLLIKLYNMIGAVGASHVLYESLDIKHILQETLGYLIVHPLFVCGHLSTSNMVLANSLRFFTGNCKDIVDYLISCYKFGSFTKIQEILDFRDQLNNSLQYASVAVEKIVMELLASKNHQATEQVLTCMEIDPEKDKTNWDQLVDKRDINVIDVYHAEHKRLVDERKGKSFHEEVQWQILRNLIVRSIAATFYLLGPLTNRINTMGDNIIGITNGNDKCNRRDVLQDLISSLKNHVTSLQSEQLVSKHFPLQAPSPSRLRIYLQSGHVSILVALLELTVYLYNLVACSPHVKPVEKVELQARNTITQELEGVLQKIHLQIGKKDNGLNPTHIRDIFEELSTLAETLGLSAIILGVNISFLKPVKSSLAKKGKKKNNVCFLQVETFQYFNDLISEVTQVTEDVLTLLQGLQSDQLMPQLSPTFVSESNIKAEDLHVEEETLKDIFDKVDKSYQQSVKELSDLVQSRIKYLRSLEL